MFSRWFYFVSFIFLCFLFVVFCLPLWLVYCYEYERNTRHTHRYWIYHIRFVIYISLWFYGKIFKLRPLSTVNIFISICMLCTVHSGTVHRIHCNHCNHCSSNNLYKCFLCVYAFVWIALRLFSLSIIIYCFGSQWSLHYQEGLNIWLAVMIRFVSV